MPSRKELMELIRKLEEALERCQSAEPKLEQVIADLKRLLEELP